MMPPDSFRREEREAYITHRLSLAEEDLTTNPDSHPLLYIGDIPKTLRGCLTY